MFSNISSGIYDFNLFCTFLLHILGAIYSDSLEEVEDEEQGGADRKSRDLHRTGWENGRDTATEWQRPKWGQGCAQNLPDRQSTTCFGRDLECLTCKECVGHWRAEGHQAVLEQLL